ncbi:hypothetical protein M5K25_013949 [Dendrobium thyrsiflorum]|uniref:Uncharacterized protein n=1 Tax=Dendrobium thyrsiflorum TaxID=117978 RepID=A0ABD0V253_DENTH
MADPERDFGMVYDKQGYVQILQSTFFDVDTEIDRTIEGYVARILDTLVLAVEDQLGTAQWYLASDPPSIIYFPTRWILYHSHERHREEAEGDDQKIGRSAPTSRSKKGRSTLGRAQEKPLKDDRSKGMKRYRLLSRQSLADECSRRSPEDDGRWCGALPDTRRFFAADRRHQKPSERFERWMPCPVQKNRTEPKEEAETKELAPGADGLKHPSSCDLQAELKEEAETEELAAGADGAPHAYALADRKTPARAAPDSSCFVP